MAKVSTRDFEDDSWLVGRPYLSTRSWQYDDTQRSSTYRHPLGIVEVDEYVGGTKPIVCMRFNADGCQYSRRWEAKWGDKTLARLARQFIEDIMNEGQNG